MIQLNADAFPRYTEYDPEVPVWCVTPNEGGCIHRFFDTPPFSPSGRYFAVLRFPQEERLNDPGETAQVVVIDLQTGEEKVVAETRGWELQLGANINWGHDDTALYYNDVDPGVWKPYAVRLNFFTGEKKKLGGPIYRISPDGKTIISASLDRMVRTQFGYGVRIPEELVPRNYGIRDDDGLYVTDTETGECKLLVSINDIFEKAVPKIPRELYENGECYGFHCKYNPQGDRLLFTLRWFPTPENGEEPWNMNSTKVIRFWIITMKPDGSDIAVAVGPEEWVKGGHHINWYPSGDKLSMNLRIDGDEKLYFVKANADGTGLEKIVDNIYGSGHPSFHKDEVHLLTDTYVKEKEAYGDGTAPIRLVNIKDKTERRIIRINIANPGQAKLSALRVDPHPVWSDDYKYIAFNGFVGGTRRVFVADVSALV